MCFCGEILKKNINTFQLKKVEKKVPLELCVLEKTCNKLSTSIPMHVLKILDYFG